MEVALMAPTLKKKKTTNPFKADQVVRATRTFAWEGGVVRKGEKYRGGDPAVVAGWNAFVPGETLDQELENPWDALPPPPEHAPPVQFTGRCAASSTSRFRSNGRRIAPAPGAGRRRHSFAAPFGSARSSTFFQIS
jgi:hypothetical protein